jgi:hypothetical protein
MRHTSSLLVLALSALAAGACRGQIDLGDVTTLDGSPGQESASGDSGVVPHHDGGVDDSDASFDFDGSFADVSFPFDGGFADVSVLSEAGPPQLPAVYQVTQAKTTASPQAGTAGITFDGTWPWVAGATGNPQPYVLEQFDPANLTVKQTTTLPSLFQTLGTSASGIAWDGSHIWISVSGDTNSLNQIDPKTGSILRSMSSPAILGPTDLDWDGTDLWLSSGTGDAYRINPATGGVDLHFRIQESQFNRDIGIAYRPGEVFSGALFGGMEAYDATTGKDLGAVVHAGGAAFTQNEVGPCVFIGAQLVVVSSNGITYYDVAKAP